MGSRFRIIAALGLAYIGLLIVVFVGVAVLITQPEQVGLMPVGDVDATATQSAQVFSVAQRTFDAYDLLATRAFELNLTVVSERESLDATATQNTTAIPATFSAARDAITSTAQRAIETLDAISTENALNVGGTAVALVSTQDANVGAALAAIEGQATLEYERGLFDRQMTNVAQEAINTQTALESTAVNLDERVTAVAQVETQAALNVLATQTETTLRNLQQATRAAEDFSSTQSAFSAQATQVELEFQGTQSALGMEATNIALTFEASAAPADSSGEVAPTLDAPLMLEDGAFLSDSGERWQLTDPTAWRLDGQGNLVAFAEQAILHSESSDYRDYTLTFEIAPAPDGDYYALLRVPSSMTTGLALHWIMAEGRMTRATLIRFNPSDLVSVGLLGNGEGVLFTATPQAAQGQRFEISVTGSRVVIDADGETLFATEVAGLNVAGGIGLQLPQDATLTQITISQ